MAALPKVFDATDVSISGPDGTWVPLAGAVSLAFGEALEAETDELRAIATGFADLSVSVSVVAIDLRTISMLMGIRPTGPWRRTEVPRLSRMHAAYHHRKTRRRNRR